MGNKLVFCVVTSLVHKRTNAVQYGLCYRPKAKLKQQNLPKMFCGFGKGSLNGTRSSKAILNHRHSWIKLFRNKIHPFVQVLYEIVCLVIFSDEHYICVWIFVELNIVKRQNNF